MKNYLGECNLKVTRPNGESSDIFLFNPDMFAVRVSST